MMPTVMRHRLRCHSPQNQVLGVAEVLLRSLLRKALVHLCHRTMLRHRLLRLVVVSLRRMEVLVRHLLLLAFPLALMTLFELVVLQVQRRHPLYWLGESVEELLVWMKLLRQASVHHRVRRAAVLRLAVELARCLVNGVVE